MMAAYLSNGQFKIPRHVNLLSAKLVEAATHPDRRVIVTMPPRHGKSETVSHWYPVWLLANDPTKRIILCSYEADFAAMWGRKVRNEINTHGKSLGIKIRDDTSAANRWELESGGGMITAGVGGPITGRGADCFIVDDPVKNAEEADSVTIRERNWQWWQSTAYSRLEPHASAVLVMTRWHEDDLAGRMIDEMKHGGERWEIVNIPAFSEGADDDALGRAEGEPLWPERYNKDDLIRIQRTVGSRHFAALYQQRPVPLGGGLFKKHWIRYYEDRADHYLLRSTAENVDHRRILKSDCWRFMTVDTAFTTKTYSDKTSIQVWDVSRNGSDMFLIDQWLDQQEAPIIEDVLIQFQKRYKPAFTGVEERTAGTVIIQKFRKNGIMLKPLKADKDKVSRALPASVWMENGKVWFPHDVSWLADLESELLSFPHGAHDDQVDAMAYAVAFASNHNLWLSKKSADLPPNSIGKLLGYDEIFGKKGRKREPIWYKDRQQSKKRRSPFAVGSFR